MGGTGGRSRGKPEPSVVMTSRSQMPAVAGSRGTPHRDSADCCRQKNGGRKCARRRDETHQGWRGWCGYRCWNGNIIVLAQQRTTKNNKDQQRPTKNNKEQQRTTQNNTDQPRTPCIHGHSVLSGLPDVYRETPPYSFSGCSFVRFSFGLWLVSKPYFISNIGITIPSSYGHPSHP